MTEQLEPNNFILIANIDRRGWVRVSQYGQQHGIYENRYTIQMLSGGLSSGVLGDWLSDIENVLFFSVGMVVCMCFPVSGNTDRC